MRHIQQIRPYGCVDRLFGTVGFHISDGDCLGPTWSCDEYFVITVDAMKNEYNHVVDRRRRFTFGHQDLPEEE